MPFQAIAYAFREEARGPLQKLIVIWLMHEADADGIVNPLDLDRLVWFCRTTERRVKVALRALSDEMGSVVAAVADDFHAARVLMPMRQDYYETGLPTPRRYRPDAEDLEWIEFYSGGKRCFACGRRGSLHVDHIYPLAKGGWDDRFNMQFLCQPCNAAKRDKLGWVEMR